MKPVFTIDLSAINSNYLYVQNICNTEVGASVKADSYGIGAAEVVRSLSEISCKKFFVATIEEGLELSTITKESIYILNGFFESEIPILIEHNLIPAINNIDQLKLWKSSYQKMPYVIHIDTGMNRLGINWQDFIKIESLPDNIEFFMSHLACDGDVNNPYNKEQLERFLKATKKYPNIPKSLAASGGSFLGKEYNFDLARVGAVLYGIGARNNKHLKNPVYLDAPIIQIQNCNSDEYIGYGSTKMINTGSKIATIPIGYADGLSRFLSNNGYVYINNKSAPIIGRISMDLTIIDVTDHDVKIGDMVEVLGDNIYPDDLASRIGTIGYEVLTSFRNGRFKRRYKR